MPVVGVSNPATMLSSVLLPQPEGPTMVRNSPAPTAMSMGLSACTASAPDPKRLDTPSISSLAEARRGAASSTICSMVIALDGCANHRGRRTCVVPAEAGTQWRSSAGLQRKPTTLDSRFRGNDGCCRCETRAQPCILSSSPRKRGPSGVRLQALRGNQRRWIPAFAGMTTWRFRGNDGAALSRE